MRRLVWVTATAAVVLVAGALVLEFSTVTDRRGLIAVNDAIPPSIVLTNLSAAWVGVMLTAGLASGVFSLFVLALTHGRGRSRR